MRSAAFPLRRFGPIVGHHALCCRYISAAALWRKSYAVPSEAHPVEEMLVDVKEALDLLREGRRIKDASNLLERSNDIAVSAFGAESESALYVRYVLCVALLNAGRVVAAEKHLRALLKAVDETSPVDRFEVRVMLADALRRQERFEEASQACQVEESDPVERQLELLALRAWLVLQQGAQGAPHEVLNEAAELSATLEAKSQSLARYGALILTMQGLVSLQAAGRWEEALERAERAVKTIEQWRMLEGSHALDRELGDALTVQGRALLEGKKYLRAEETLEKALALYEDDHGRAAEALLALGSLFKATNSNMYAEGTYRKLLSIIDRDEGASVAPEHVREAYDQYAWFLRRNHRKKEAEEIEQEYIRLYHNKT